MATTAVFIEILLVGIQAVIWMLMLLLIVVGPAEAKDLPWDDIESWAALLSFAIAGMAYAAGVIVDRLADSLFTLVIGPIVCGDERKKWLKKSKNFWSKNAEKDDTVGNGEKRLLVRQYGGDMTTFLDYVRSRLRIARSTALNLALVTTFAVCLTQDADARRLIAAVGALATGLTVFAWKRINITWNDRLDQAFKLARRAQKAAEKA